MTPRVTVSSDIDQSFLLQQGLLSGPNARERRAVVGEKLHIGYTNGKQLIKRLNAFWYQTYTSRRSVERTNAKWEKQLILLIQQEHKQF